MSNAIKHRFGLLTATAVAVAIACAAAWAANPHFVGKVKATIDGSGDVQVCWKEAGLGDNQNITYTAGAEATATYVCKNNGGQCPNAANKETVNGPVSATGTFASGKNGSITACLTFSPPDAGTFTCPGGQTLTLADVSYSNIHVSDDTNNVTASATPSSISAVVFVCPNP
jgi:hypothetical protein